MLCSCSFRGFLSKRRTAKQHLVIEISMSVTHQRGISRSSNFPSTRWNEIRMGGVSDSDEIRSRPVPWRRLSGVQDK
jgi:hypothetical protein